MNCLCHHFSKFFPQLVWVFNSFTAGCHCYVKCFIETSVSLQPFFFTQWAFVCLPPILSMHSDDNAPFFSADVKRELDDLSTTVKNFEARVGFAKDLETISAVCCITTGRLTDQILHKV